MAITMDWSEAVHKAYACLELERRIVGINLFAAKEDFDAAQGKHPVTDMNYCQAIAAATNGHCIKLEYRTFRCQGGLKALGVSHEDPLNSHGENWCRIGLYDGPERSREIREGLDFLRQDTFGVQISPAESLTNAPDVAIVVGTPYVMMRVSQGYAYHHGFPKSLRFIGNQAFCVECTTRPYITDDINFSMLCIGTRHQAQWKDYEAAVGMPGKMFSVVVDGIWQTVNIMENDENKAKIGSKADAAGLDLSVRYHYNYYMDTQYPLKK